MNLNPGGERQPAPHDHGVDVVVRTPEDLAPRPRPCLPEATVSVRLQDFGHARPSWRHRCAFRGTLSGRDIAGRRRGHGGWQGMRPSVGYPHDGPVGGSRDGPGAREGAYAGTTPPDSRCRSRRLQAWSRHADRNDRARRRRPLRTERTGDSQEGQALAETPHGMFSRGADGGAAPSVCTREGTPPLVRSMMLAGIPTDSERSERFSRRPRRFSTLSLANPKSSRTRRSVRGCLQRAGRDARVRRTRRGLSGCGVDVSTT